MKNTKKTVNLYHRILKYPPWAIGRKTGIMRIVHKLKSGEIIATAKEYITTEDAEKLFTILYISEQQKTIKTIETNDKELGNIVKINLNIKDIKKLINSHDEKSILESINRLLGLSITYDFKIEKKGINILIKYSFIKATGDLTLFFNESFINACINQNLKIDIDKYIKLSPGGKNLYGYIISNSGDNFKEDLLIERVVISSGKKYKAQQMLKKALNEIKDNYIIKNFKIEKKNKERYINIVKIKENKQKNNSRSWYKKLAVAGIKNENKNGEI